MGLETHLQMFGHSVNCWHASLPGEGPRHSHPTESPGALTCSTPPNLENFWLFPQLSSAPALLLLCSWHSQLFESYCSLRSGAKEGRVSKILPANQSHHLSAGVSSLITSKGSAGLGQICQFSQAWFSFFFSCSIPNQSCVCCPHSFFPTP